MRGDRPCGWFLDLVVLLSIHMCIVRGSFHLQHTQNNADVMPLSNILMGNFYFIRKCGFVFFSRSLRMSGARFPLPYH